MEYVKEEPSFSFDYIAGVCEGVSSSHPKPKRKYVRKNKVNLELEDDETRRKRDVLASVACLENIEDYVGEKIKPIEFRNMTKERLEALFDLYQQKAGQELAADGMKAAINVFTKALNYFGVEFEDKHELEQDLMENRFLKRTIGRQSSKIAERYGDLVGVLKAVADVCKHAKGLRPLETPSNEVERGFVRGLSPLTGASDVQADASNVQADASKVQADASKK